jgi:hypothetical protein
LTGLKVILICPADWDYSDVLDAAKNIKPRKTKMQRGGEGVVKIVAIMNGFLPRLWIQMGGGFKAGVVCYAAVSRYIGQNT